MDRRRGPACGLSVLPGTFELHRGRHHEVLPHIFFAAHSSAQTDGAPPSPRRFPHWCGRRSAMPEPPIAVPVGRVYYRNDDLSIALLACIIASRVGSERFVGWIKEMKNRREEGRRAG